MKKIKREADFSAEQLNTISALASSTGLCRQTVAILLARGIDTPEKMSAFLHPSKKHFLSPFLMSGMSAAKELITLARDEGWEVVVYGDYDADGVSASTIMVRSLHDFGIDAHVFVPERRNGYGLNIPSIDLIFEEYCPQLFITVDCGISNAAEVEYIKEQGAEVIVTDHHELPAVLPDCICINPKIKDDYPYDNLCGAGVAFKVGCALNGRNAYDYLDYAAIATVADSVPLTGENRDIVAEGLKLINAHPRKNYAEFLSRSERVTAQTLAFSVAPKVNAAGRMGDAGAALTLFLSEDQEEIYQYSVKLASYNLERQKYCDELYASAKRKIKEKGISGRVIVLWDESWNTGFVGIVAARLCEEYCRPTLLFVKNGDMLKGSARCIEGVNIFEALKSCEDIISEFGGHSQAAGVNITEENLGLLEERLNKYMYDNYTAEAFAPTAYVSGRFDPSEVRKLVGELEMLEPYGVGNKRPVFVMDAGALPVRPLKAGSAHLTLRVKGLEMMYFSGLRQAPLLTSAIPKKLIFEYNLSVFRGREYVKGFVRDVVYDGSLNLPVGEYPAMVALNALTNPPVNCVRREIRHATAQHFIDSCGEYGTVFIAYDRATLNEFRLRNLEVNVFYPAEGKLSCIVLLAPCDDCDLSGYERVVYLDSVCAVRLKSLEGKQVAVCTEHRGTEQFASLVSDRDTMLTVFRAISANCGRFCGETAIDSALSVELGFSGSQTLFAMKVFEQLGLLSISGGRVSLTRGVKTQLGNSQLYNFICSIK